MPMPRKHDPDRFCERCGTQFFRRRRERPRGAEGRTITDWEAPRDFAKRKYCSLSCANSTGASTKAGAYAQSIRKRGMQCEACGALANLHNHHVDGSIYNNADTNLQTLCESCHAFWHGMLKRLGRPLGHRMPKVWDF